MYIHLGDGTSVRKSDIIGVFDLEVTTTMKTTGEFLHVASEEEFTVDIANRGEMPKSFIIAEENGRSRVYISPIAAGTIRKRLSGIIDE